MNKRLHLAECDIDLALKYKAEYPEIAKIQYNNSVELIQEFKMQHEAIVNLIGNYKRDGHEVPEAMQAIYDYLHQEYMDTAADIKAKQDLFKS